MKNTDKDSEHGVLISHAALFIIYTTPVVSSDYVRECLILEGPGRMRNSTLRKVKCLLQKTSHGLPSDLSDELIDVSEAKGSSFPQEFL